MAKDRDLLAELAAAKAENEALKASLAKSNAPKARVARNIPTFPSVELKDEAGNVTQREISHKLISAGGPWYTVAHIGEVVSSGERVLFLRKYRTITVKEGKAREGETVGQKVLRQASSFRINSGDHWAEICAYAQGCFSPEAESTPEEVRA